MPLLQEGTSALEEKYACDSLDERILKALSEDARSSFRVIAKGLKVSTSTVVQRVKRLEQAGIIRGYAAVYDYSKLGYEFVGLVEVTINKGALLAVQKKISLLPGVVAVYDVTGLSDSMVLIRTKNRNEFSKLVKTILAIEQVERSNTHVILNVVKEEYRQFL